MTYVAATSVLALLDAGRDLCRTDAELGRQLGMSRARLADVRAGRLGLTSEQAARLGLLVGVDPKTVLALDAIERQRDPERAGWLRRAFFTGAALGVAFWLQLHSVVAIAAINEIQQLNIHCRALIRVLRKLLGDAFGPGSMAAPPSPEYGSRPFG